LVNYRGGMPLFSRRPALPPSVRAHLDLRGGDTVLAAAQLTDGTWAVASRRALHLAPGGAGPALSDSAVARHGWSEVERAGFDPEASELTVHWASGSSQCLALADLGGSARFVQVFRERVQASVVHSEVLSLPAGGVVKVALRRDEEGDLLSQVIGDGKVDLSDPKVAALVDAAEQRVRGAAGLPL
jgi:hypothetical protein